MNNPARKKRLAIKLNMKTNRNLLITVDLGNSSTTYGVHRNNKIRASGYVKSNEIPKLSRLLAKSGVFNHSPQLIISSVVPHLTDKLINRVTKYIPKRSIFVVGRDVRPYVAMRYKRRVLGSDRLVNIYGGLRLYKLPLLIVDFGTAITFDYVSKSGIFEGGLIVPGIEVASDALQENTALLPKIGPIKPVRTLIGRDPKSAMSSGLLNGFGALSDGLIERFRKQYSRKLVVVATGGFASRMAEYVDNFDYVDPLHTIRSLAIIYRNEVMSKTRRKCF